MRSDELTFTLTTEHIKLLRHAYVSWDYCEYGAPSIDPKRPYGNSSVEQDIAEILGIEPDELDKVYDEMTYSNSVLDRLRTLHGETVIALQVILRTGSFEPGLYRRSQTWMTDWERV